MYGELHGLQAQTLRQLECICYSELKSKECGLGLQRERKQFTGRWNEQMFGKERLLAIQKQLDTEKNSNKLTLLGSS